MMKLFGTALLCCAMAAIPPSSAWSKAHATTAQGQADVSGGVATAEQKRLLAERGKQSLSLFTAAQDR